MILSSLDFCIDIHCITLHLGFLPDIDANAKSATKPVSYKILNLNKRPQDKAVSAFYGRFQRYTYRVLQTIQMKLILLWVWAERAVLGRAKTALKFNYEI